MDPRSGGPPVILVNRAAGAGEADEAALAELFAEARVVGCAPAELATRAEAALAHRPSYLGVAGGDGTVRSVAERMVGGDTPLVVVPAGTRNHLSRALGIDEPERAAEAAAGAVTRRIDVGEVNGRVFLNNSSIGAYPSMVDRRERHDRAPKWLAQLLAVIEEVRAGHALHVVVDGRRVRAWLVFVGNNRYGGELGRLGDRSALDANELDVRVIRARRPLPRTRLLAAALTGRLRRSAVVDASVCREVEVDVVGRREIDVAFDGELETLTLPLRYRSHAGALGVLVPPDD